MNQTTVQVTGLAAGITTILFWILGFFQPELMASAPTGLESAVTTVFAVVAGLLLPRDALTRKHPDDTNK